MSPLQSVETSYILELYHLLAKHLPDVRIALYNADLRFVLVEGGDLELFNAAPETFVGYSVEEVALPQEYALLEPFFRAALTGETRTLEMRTEQGRVRQLIFAPVNDSSGAVVFGSLISRDITHNARIEAQLRERDERLNSVLAHLQDCVFTVRLPDDALLYMSSAVEALTGYPLARFYDDFSLWQSLVHPFDQQWLRDESQRLIEAHGHYDLTYRIVRADGEIRWVRTRLWRTQTGEQPDGRLDGIITDITDQKQGELHAIQLTLEQEKVRLLARFIGHVWHDFVTPLSIVNTSAHLMARSSDAERRQHHLSSILEQVSIIQDVIDSSLLLIQLENEPRYQFEVLRINEVLADVDRLLQPRYTQKGQQVTLTLGAALAPTVGDYSHLQRAIGNVFRNAIEFTPEGGQIDVRSYGEGENLIVEIRDTGTGIAPEDLPHIFERFYKPAHRPTGGAGLGLTIAQLVVGAHGGDIRVNSAPGVGSTFRICLPKQNIKER